MDMILEGSDLAFGYAGKPLVFENISLTVEAGEVFCILGPNGVGKSTLLSCLCGLIEPDRGEIRLDGENISSLSRRQIARSMAFVAQSQNSVFDYPVQTFVEMGCAAHLGMFAAPGKEEAESARLALARLNIAHLAGNLMSEVSGGERQLATIARALVQRPRLIILDEPASHLDLGNQMRLLDTLDELAASGFSIVFTTHVPDHADAVADRTTLMRRAHPVEIGPTRSILTERNLSETYGIEVALSDTGHGLFAVPIRKSRRRCLHST